MRRIDIRELPNETAEEIRAGDTYEVEVEGEVVGYLIPVKHVDPEESKRAFEAFDRLLDETLINGYTREQLAEDLDLSKPFAGES